MINLYDLLEAATGQLFGEPVAKFFTDFCYDSRDIEPGQLYTVMRTERGDGHQFIGEAVAGGAAGVLCARPPDVDVSSVTCLIVKDVQAALLLWAEYILRRYGTTVINVVGSPGASTAREAITKILDTRYRVYNPGAAYQGQGELPLALSRLERDHQIAVLQVESERPGDMEAISSLVKPLVAVVTEVPGKPSYQVEEYRKFIQMLPDDGLAVLNFDDDDARALVKSASSPVTTFGMDPSGIAYGADLIAYNVQLTRYRTSFDLKYAEERLLGRWMRLLGTRQLYGVLPALLVGLAYDVTLEEGAQVLSELTPMPGRLRALEGVEGCMLIDDSFDATVESTLRTLDWLETVREDEPEGRIVFILGDVAPPNTAQPHIGELGHRIADVVDKLLTQGRMAAKVGRAAIAHGMPRENVHVTFCPGDTANCTRADVRREDLLVVSGAAHAHMENTLRGLLLHPADTNMLVKKRLAIHTNRLTITREAQRTWVEIDLNALGHNVRQLKSVVGENVNLLAVVRADGYGHGAVEVGATAVLNGADYLGVGSPEEGLALREAGVDAPILIMGYTPGRLARHMIENDLSVTLVDLDTARALSDEAEGRNTQINVHYQIDIGTRRLGVLAREVPAFFRRAIGMKGLNHEGLYTQFDGSDQTNIQQQIADFRQISSSLRASGIRFKHIHAADTAAAIAQPESRFSMVRIGSGLYGLNPSNTVTLPDTFLPVMSWKTRIVQVKNPSSEADARSSAIVARKKLSECSEEAIAVIPVGYADGLRKDWPYALVRGQRVPLAGSMGMNHTALSMAEAPNLCVGDEVILIGNQADETITANEVAQNLGISPHAVVTNIIPHSPGGRVITS